VRRMVVAPHCDDETLGPGGLLAKYPDTVVLVVAQPTGERVDEFHRGMEKLAVNSVWGLGLVDGQVGADPMHLVTLLDKRLAEYQPEELYLPAPGTHQDHIATYEAGMRAARLSMNRDHWTPPTVLLYDVPAYDLELYPTHVQWNVYEQLDPVHLQRKVDAAACYDSQVPNGEHPAAAEQIRAEARLAGSEVGLLFAERYSAVRIVR
jgi:N-acetylglucosamine malate deacetylase 1